MLDTIVPVPTERDDARVARVRPGGAARVAATAAAIGARVTLFGVCGADPQGEELLAILRGVGVDTDAVRCDASRETILKGYTHDGCTILSRDHREWKSPLAYEASSSLLAEVSEQRAEFDAICVSDYSKSVIRPELIPSLIATCRGDLPIVSDTKSDRLAFFAGVTLLKISDSDVPQWREHANNVMERSATPVAVTLGAAGLVFSDGRGSRPLPRVGRRGRWSLGAGDAFAATVTVGLSHGLDSLSAVRLGQLASEAVANLELGEVLTMGTFEDSVTRQTGSSRKLQTLTGLLEDVREWRQLGCRIVFTNGCFDLLHCGHIATLEYCRKVGDVVVVGINSDPSVRALKGSQRPLVPDIKRATLVAALECVDRVVLFDDLTPEAIIHELRPDVLVKGGDYARDAVVGGAFVQSYGGQVLIAPLLENSSTSALLAQAQRGAPLLKATE